MTTRSTDKMKELLERLAQGVSLLTTEQRWRDFLTVQARFRRYSFQNVMLILLQCPRATRVAGFRTWQSLGRHVNKGERGLAIFAPLMLKKKRNVDVDSDATDGGDEGARRLAFRLVHVFDVSQTSGAELPSPVTTLDGDEERAAALIDSLTAFALARGLHVKLQEDIASGANGTFDRTTSTITLKTTLPVLQRAKTFAHELGHALLHANEISCHERAIMEVEAESVAYLVLANVGLDAGDYSFGYVATWMAGDADEATRTITASGNRIAKAAREIVDACCSSEQADIEPESTLLAA